MIRDMTFLLFGVWHSTLIVLVKWHRVSFVLHKGLLEELLALVRK